MRGSDYSIDRRAENLPSKQYPNPYSIQQSGSARVDDFKTVVIYSTLGIATATGVFFLARHLYKKTRAKKVEKQSLYEGSPATYAKQLKMAFDNDNWASWGTDEEKIFQVFREIPSKAAYQKVQKAYLDLYGKNLNSDLESELSSEEYNAIIRLVAGKKER